MKQNGQQQIEELKREIEELKNNWKRALADYQNLEKRVALEKQEFAVWANANLITKLLPALDSLKKAAEQLKDEGVRLAVKQLEEALEEEGLTKIEVLGKEFTPIEMECVAAVIGKKEDEGKVAEEVRTGYNLGGRVLRAAQVTVYKKNV